MKHERSKAMQLGLGISTRSSPPVPAALLMPWLVACTMPNPAFDPPTEQENHGSEDGSSYSGMDGKDEAQEDGDGDGDPMTCVGLMVEGECPTCISNNCCTQVEGCLGDLGCECLLECLYLQNNTEGICFAECSPDASSQDLFAGVGGCLSQSCGASCGAP